MKTSRIIMLIALMGLNVSWGFAQEPKFVCVNNDLANDIVDDLIKKQGASIGEKDKAWAKSLLNEAFQLYFANKKAKALVYSKEKVSELEQNAKSLNDTIQSRDKIIKKLKHQIKTENLEGKLAKAKQEWESEHKQMVAQHNQVLKENEKAISKLKERVNILMGDSVKYTKEIEKYQKNAFIVENVQKMYNEKSSVLYTLYMEHKNSQTLEFVKCDNIQYAISDYSDYLKIVGLPMPAEQKSQIEYLYSVKEVGRLYKSAVGILDSLYNEAAVRTWLSEYKNASVHIEKLNAGQKTIIVQMQKNISLYPDEFKHFKNVLLNNYLKKEGQIPDNETIKKIKDEIEFRVDFHVGGNTYNPCYTNLNRTLNEILQGLRIMDEKEYGEFLIKIEKAL